MPLLRIFFISGFLCFEYLYTYLFSVEEFTAKTDFEGIKTEIFDKETTGAKETTGGATNIDGLVTEQGFGTE